MFHSSIPPVHHSVGVVALAIDDIRNDKLNSIFGLQHNVVSVDSIKEILHNIWDNGRSSNIFIFDV